MMNPKGYSVWAAGQASGHLGEEQPSTSRAFRRSTQRRLRREAKQQHKLQFRGEEA